MFSIKLKYKTGMTQIILQTYGALMILGGIEVN